MKHINCERSCTENGTSSKDKINRTELELENKATNQYKKKCKKIWNVLLVPVI